MSNITAFWPAVVSTGSACLGLPEEVCAVFVGFYGKTGVTVVAVMLVALLLSEEALCRASFLFSGMVATEVCDVVGGGGGGCGGSLAVAVALVVAISRCCRCLRLGRWCGLDEEDRVDGSFWLMMASALLPRRATVYKSHISTQCFCRFVPGNRS